MSGTRSTLLTMLAGAGLAVASFAGLRAMPIAHAQTRLQTFTPRTISATEIDDLAGLEQADKATADLVDFVQPGVVHIISESKVHRDVMGNLIPGMGGEGSGVVYRPDGYIITNDHVVGGFDKVTVVLEDGQKLEGKVIRAQDMDIAVVKVDAKDLPTLPFGDSGKVRAGQFSMAVGSPFGLDNTVTFGHISAIGRTNEIPDDRLNVVRDYPDLIQTDTAINMGNSGGPLVNVRGEVIGINTAIYSPTGMNNGIGFAIPSNTARLIADKLISDGKIQRGALGLRPSTLEPYKAKQMSIPGGAYVQEVVNGTPAAIAGIKQGDVIVRVGNIPVKTETDIRDAMLNYAPGEKVEVEVIRGSEHKTFNVTLTSQDKLPDRRPAAPQDVNPFGPGLQVPDFGDQGGNGSGGSDGNVPPLKEGNARLGVTVGDLTSGLREQFHVPANAQGALVTSVADGSVAEKVGLQVGDVVQELGGKTVTSAESLKQAMENRKWGESCIIKFSRFGEHSVATMSVPFNF